MAEGGESGSFRRLLDEHQRADDIERRFRKLEIDLKQERELAASERRRLQDVSNRLGRAKDALDALLHLGLLPLVLGLGVYLATRFSGIELVALWLGGGAIVATLHRYLAGKIQAI